MPTKRNVGLNKDPLLHGAELKSVGVDYITVTTKDRNRIRHQVNLAEGLVDHEEQRGCFARPWSLAGFEGFVCGEVEFGMREAETIIRLRSALAHEYWFMVYERAENCSRIDVEATSWQERPVSERLGRCFELTSNYWATQKQFVEPKCISGPLGPQTLYLGNRQSDVFLRAYDYFRKHTSVGFENCLRYEAEIKGKRSRVLASVLSRDSCTSARICNNLRAMFEKRGCPIEFTAGREHLLIAPPGAADRRRLLEWLSVQVRATVTKLVRQGAPEEVYEALGLTYEGGPSGPRWQQVREGAKSDE